MKATRTILILCLIVLGGCWDSASSPIIKNMSGQDITLHLIFDDREDSYIIKSDDSLLLPNLLNQENLKSIKVSSYGEISVKISQKDVAKFMQEEKKVFAILKGLAVDVRSNLD